MVQRRLVGKRLKPEGWACACLLLFLFWPLTCVPCCLDDCKGVLWAHTSTYCHLTAFPPHYDCFRQTEEVRVSAWDLSSSRADYLPRAPSLLIDLGGRVRHASGTHGRFAGHVLDTADGCCPLAATAAASCTHALSGAEWTRPHVPWRIFSETTLAYRKHGRHHAPSHSLPRVFASQTAAVCP
jgi:hypothetical protein